MRSRAPLRLLAAAATIASLALCGHASADVFGPIELVSAGHLPGLAAVQQAEEAKDSVISANGRYVAFDGSFDGKPGVFRRDLQTGEIAVVAEGPAVMPSISEEGRYVSFTTTARLDEENDVNPAPDVYVRDMDVPSDEPCPPEWEQDSGQCPFTLASAVNGSAQGFRYVYPSEEYGSGVAFNETHYGSIASGRSALSANGDEVVFVTTAAVDLNGGEAPLVPRLQVMVRYLSSKRTELVSTLLRGGEETSEPVPPGREFDGAVYVGDPAAPLPFPNLGGGASLSADGSTVAWLGTEIDEQAPLLGSESVVEDYTEPLWRRVGEGASSPTRRVTGGSDPLSPQCQQSGQTSLAAPPTLADPCQGPFETTGGLGGLPGLYTGNLEWNYVPQLSADGLTVAFLATARYIASGEELRSSEYSDDLYVADMRSGLTRVQALRRLTELAGGTANNPGRVNPIKDLAVSRDGTQVAFTSARTVFPLGSPAFVSAPEGAAFLTEIYDADLADDTLTRVTTGYEGQRTEAAAGEDQTASPSFSGDGSLLSFSSTEDDLVYGDGNDASDAFVVPRLSFPAFPAPEAISSPPPNPAVVPGWMLSVTAASRRNGTVMLYVDVPGAGGLQALARGEVASVSSARASSHKRRKRRAHASVTMRSVASSARALAGGGLVELPLQLAGGYAGQAESPHGLYATATVSFRSPGHPALKQTIHVVFRRAPRPHAHSAKKRGRKR